jgi:FecR protein/Domain of unknown function (DUF4398)
MAKAKKSSGADLDWYLISIDRLKQIGAIVLILLVGGAGYWFWKNQKDNPQKTAMGAITDARQALNSLAASPEFNAHRNEFSRAQQKLDEANAHFTAGRYEDAQGAAIESRTISTTAMSGQTDVENDAQFLTVEGDVKYQRAASSEWKDADARTALFNGDWVKTANRASAELIFSNGTLYTVGPNALLEIFAQVNPQTSKKTNAVQMKVGSVEVATSEDASTVRTPGAQVVVDSESTTQVGIDSASEGTSVMATRGSASIKPETGGNEVRLAAGERVSSTKTGAISPVKKLAQPPALLSPADNQVYPLSADLKVELVWDAQPGATGYQLQVSRSRLFATHEINTRRTKTSAGAAVSQEGSFYWRVATIGADGEIGPFSSFRRFRISGGKSGSTDNVAPPLTMKAPYSLGGPIYLISGTTEPGATVFINDEEVDVDSKGAYQKIVSFGKLGPNPVVHKAVDAAGNSTVKSQTVIVEE